MRTDVAGVIIALVLAFAGMLSVCAQDAKESEVRKVDAFSSIEITSVGTIHFTQSDTYSFRIEGREKYVKNTETTVKDGFDLVQNRFFIKGEGEILYNYNHGHIASDPKLAVANFLNALDTMPALLEKYKTDNEKQMKDVPTLKAVAESLWKKEDELKELKSEMVVMERKIEASLKPIGQSAGIMAGVAKEDAKSFQIPERLQAAKEVMGDRLVIVRPSHGVPEKKGFKI